MNALRQLTMFSKLMLGICLVLGIVIIAEAAIINFDWTRADGDAGTRPESVSPAAVASVNPLMIPPIVTYSDIVERPLFSDTRRPPQTTIDKNTAPASQLGSAWKLTGIVVAADSSSVLVSGIRDSRTERLQAGMMLDGWRLESITRDQAVFSSGGRTAVLRLHEEKEEPAITPIKRR
jgi:hypothetical protein